MAFRYEAELNQTIIDNNILSRSIGLRPSSGYSLQEVKGYFGIPDFVLYDLRKKTRKKEKLYSFECKLRNWKRALIQAFRYKTFSGVSFVIMDLDHVKPAVENISEFEKSNIGLIGVGNDGEYEVFHQPEFEEPFTESMYFDLLNEIESSGGG